MKEPELEPPPAGAVTLMVPEEAPAGTVAVIRVTVLTVNVADTPLKRTAEALRKFAPLMVTELPTVPLVGEILEMAGGR